MPKQINFEWHKWMTLAVVSVIFFVVSYLMAITSPDCPTCRVGEISGVEAFHGAFSFLFGCAAVVTCVGAALKWDGWE